MLVFAAAVVCASTGWWLFQLASFIRVARAMPMLARVPDSRPGPWPRVSVISTACNEGGHIAAALRRKMADDYPDVEYILVEDRSTDDTPAVADRLAAEDPRLAVVHVRELPAGWLGKLNALEQGARRATGDWLLFSDADVHFENHALRRAIALAESRGLDHLAVLPSLSYVNFALDPVFGLFVRMICMAGQVWSVENPKSKAAAGCGSFNLVRREALERAGGFAPIRMEVADDLCLGKLLKYSGSRQSLANGRDCLSVALIRSFREGALSSERATWTDIGRFSLTRLTLMALFLLVAEMGVFIALLPGLPGWVLAVGLGGIAVSLAVSVGTSAWANRRFAAALLWPYALFIQLYLMVRAGVLGRARGGIWWRGTFYPDAQLKAGKRF